MAAAVAVLAVALLALVPASASAFRTGGQRWPGGVVRYHAATPAYDAAIRAAVRAWNASGASIELRATTQARAQLRIDDVPNLNGAAGVATLGYAAPGLVTLRLLGRNFVGGFSGAPCGALLPVPSVLAGPRRQRVRCLRGARMLLLRPGRRRPVSAYERVQRAVVVAHELGHVLGLRHNQPACSVMSYRREDNCPAPEEEWRFRCRLLERDDVRGAVARYGGRVRPLARPFCDRAPAPPPPREVTATLAPDRSVLVEWTRTAGDVTFGYRTAGAFGACPTVPGDGPYGLGRATRQSDRLVPDPGGSGPFCVAVWHEDAYGRLAGPVTATVDVPPLATDPFPER